MLMNLLSPITSLNPQIQWNVEHMPHTPSSQFRMSLLSDAHDQTPWCANDLLYSHQKEGTSNSASYSFQQIIANSAVKMYILHKVLWPIFTMMIHIKYAVYLATATTDFSREANFHNVWQTPFLKAINPLQTVKTPEAQ